MTLHAANPANPARPEATLDATAGPARLDATADATLDATADATLHATADATLHATADAAPYTTPARLIYRKPDATAGPAGRDAGPDATAARLIYRKPDVLNARSTHYCPGCGHGVIHRLLAEVLTELDLPAHTIAVAPVGCAVFAYDYLNIDFVEAPHGRAPAVATGIRRVRPEAFVLTYQGDGDLAAIGTAEIVHAAARG